MAIFEDAYNSASRLYSKVRVELWRCVGVIIGADGFRWSPCTSPHPLCPLLSVSLETRTGALGSLQDFNSTPETKNRPGNQQPTICTDLGRDVIWLRSDKATGLFEGW